MDISTITAGWHPWQWWVAVSALCLLLEMFTTSFFVFFFAVGALAAALFAFVAGHEMTIELGVFLVVSIACLYLFRPLFCRWFHIGQTPATLSNTDALIGQDARVLDTVTQDGGRIKLRQTGEVWTAFTHAADVEYSVNATVYVERVDGAKLLVSDSKPA